jgi:hypothetical protein
VVPLSRGGSSSRVSVTEQSASPVGGTVGPVVGSTGLSTPCERGCHLVETARRDIHARPAGTGSPQVRGLLRGGWRGCRWYCGEGPRRTLGNSTRSEHNAARTAPARRYPQVAETRTSSGSAGRVRDPVHTRPVPTRSLRRGDLTSSIAPAYRFSVTRCRRVPHVHVTSRPASGDAYRGGSAWAGGAGRNRRLPSGFRSAPSDAIGRSGRSAGVIRP